MDLGISRYLVANNNFNYNIFSIDVDGIEEQAITSDEELISVNPSVAPFGDWLAFEQGRGSYDIYVASSNGEQLLHVANGEGDRRVPEWRVVIDQ